MAFPLTDSPTGFDRFGLDSTILRGVRAAGFVSPRPIQVETIPAVLAGRDVLGLAQTGTGKTAAFALPLLHRLLRRQRRGPRVLVLAPTRELATQIDAEIRTLARFTSLRGVIIYGGVSAHGKIKVLRKHPEIVVGCPGRILDLIGRGVLRRGEVESVVLDEADHMFDMGVAAAEAAESVVFRHHAPGDPHARRRAAAESARRRAGALRPGKDHRPRPGGGS